LAWTVLKAKPSRKADTVNLIAGGRIVNEEVDKMPDVPAGARLLRTGESIQVGDFHWCKVHKRWREVIEAIDLSVSEPQQGFYCRKKSLSNHNGRDFIRQSLLNSF
jgi:hypothetical protein